MIQRNGTVVPFRGEWATLWKSWLYPFRRQDTAEGFLGELQAGVWEESQLKDFERYGK